LLKLSKEKTGTHAGTFTGTGKLSGTPMNQNHFDHEKLDVYQIALEFVAHANTTIKTLPKGKANLADELHRASTSITLNIAEGAGEFSKNEKIRFYRMAKRSATECASIFDICKKLHLVEMENIFKARELLTRIVAMLTKLVKAKNEN
jgi:four helix bundle protein